MRTVAPRLAAGLSAGVLVLTGCGGNPSPAPPPKAPPTSTPPSASPSASAPVMPAAARAKTKAGAEAFARGFLETVNYAGSTGDTKLLRTLYAALCTRCEAIADGIDQIYASAGSIEGGSWHATSFRFYGIRNEVAFLDVLVDYDAQSLTRSQGASPTAFPASRRNLKAFNLRWSDSGWTVSALDPNA